MSISDDALEDEVAPIVMSWREIMRSLEEEREARAPAAAGPDDTAGGLLAPTSIALLEDLSDDELWRELCALEPSLGNLLQRCERVRSDHNPHFCANRLWYRELKDDLTHLVGWEARGNDPILRSSRAYDVAYDRCYRALPACRDCGCL